MNAEELFRNIQRNPPDTAVDANGELTLVWYFDIDSSHTTIHIQFS